MACRTRRRRRRSSRSGHKLPWTSVAVLRTATSRQASRKEPWITVRVAVGTGVRQVVAVNFSGTRDENFPGGDSLVFGGDAVQVGLAWNEVRHGEERGGGPCHRSRAGEVGTGRLG